MRHILTLEEFSIRGKKSDKVLVFDIDDTLITSNAKVLVKKNEEVVKELNSSEFNEYKLKDGEVYSFEKFRDLGIMLSSEMRPYFDTLKREYARGVHIAILTAREDKDMIHNFFIQKSGIDIHPKLIFTTGDDKSDCSIAEKKAKCIRKLVQYGYTTLVFFDDNIDNLHSAQKMGKELGVKIHIVKA